MSRVDEWVGVPEGEGNITLKIKENCQTEASCDRKSDSSMTAIAIVAIVINLAIVKNIHHPEGERRKHAYCPVTSLGGTTVISELCRINIFRKYRLSFAQIFEETPASNAESRVLLISEEKFCFCFFSLSSHSHFYHQREGLFPFR